MPSDTTLTYTVTGMSCAHCSAAVTDEVSQVDGVTSVDVDLDAQRVQVDGSGLDDAAIRAAVAEAGYEVAS